MPMQGNSYSGIIKAPLLTQHLTKCTEMETIKTFINTILSCDIPNTYENFDAGAEFLCSVTAGTLLKKLYMSYHAIGRN